jgi:hypothetical protein
MPSNYAELPAIQQEADPATPAFLSQHYYCIPKPKSKVLTFTIVQLHAEYIPTCGSAAVRFPKIHS